MSIILHQYKIYENYFYHNKHVFEEKNKSFRRTNNYPFVIKKRIYWKSKF